MDDAANDIDAADDIDIAHDAADDIDVARDAGVFVDAADSIDMILMVQLQIVLQMIPMMKLRVML